MVEIRITRELGDYSPKLVGPLTARQFLCVLCGVVPCYLMYTQLKPYLPIDVIGFFCIIPAGFAVAFGWLKPYGMKMEVYLRSIFITRCLAPSTRRYRGKNRINRLISKIETAEKAAMEETAGKGKRKKKTKPEKPNKYKRSPLAYD